MAASEPLGVSVVPGPEIDVILCASYETSVHQQLQALGWFEVLASWIRVWAPVRVKGVEAAIDIEVEGVPTSIVAPKAGPPLGIAAPTP